MNSSREQVLIERCRKGDRQALEVLIGEYQRPLYNAAYRILGNPDDAADATQAAFLKAFEHLDQYKPEFRFFSWIYRIAINESINQLKRGRRLQPLGDNEVASASTDSPEAEAAHGDLSREVQLGLMALTDDYRTVIVLRHFSECSYRQISEILQIPEKTVKSRLYSARQLMKDQLLASGMH
jgi:RNA polymerase sigma-70 factor (ECF subfamily)